MRSLLAVLMLALPGSALAQSDVERDPARSGFVFGAAVGGGMIDLSGPSVEPGRAGSASFPNLRVGCMVSDRTAFLLQLPGNIYRHRGLDAEDRDRDRAFEGIIPSLQRWLTDRWWIVGGVGLALDSPAFYDIEDSSERVFHVGVSAEAGAGYEVWRSGGYSLDLQGRVLYGRATLPRGDHLEGYAINAMVGFSSY